MDGNYIKLNRSLLEWEWYTDANTMRLWVHLLLKANWKAGRFLGEKVERGQLITSYPVLAEELGLSIQQIRTSLKHLELTGEITRKSTHRWQVITVEKYSLFQDVPTKANRRATDEQQTSNRRVTTIEEKKEEKELKEEKEINNTLYPSISDRLTDDEWGELERKLSNSDIVSLIDEIDLKGNVQSIHSPYSYIIGMANKRGLLNGL